MGALAGMTEVFCQQPTVAWKNAMQEGRPIPFAPRVMYRGVLVNAFSIAPCNATQFAVNSAASSLFRRLRGDPKAELSTAERLAGAVTGGAMSALLATPAELVMLQQQKHGGDLWGWFRRIYTEHGVGSAGLQRGLAAAAIRDSFYVGSYLGATPLLREHLQANYPVARDNPAVAKIASGLSAGLIAVVLSHPFDTVRTLQASELKTGPYHDKGLLDALATAYKERGGLGGLYQGVVPRGMRVCGAVLIINEASERYRGLLGLAPPTSA